MTAKLCWYAQCLRPARPGARALTWPPCYATTAYCNYFLHSRVLALAY